MSRNRHLSQPQTPKFRSESATLMICMDDTDNLESKGMGFLVEVACREMTAMSWNSYSMISRHQLKTICINGRSTLLVHPSNGDGVHAVLAKEELKRY